MISIADTISPECIRLALRATTGPEAIRETAELLRTDAAVFDWDELYAGMVRSAPCLSESDGEFGICLPHARTDAVSAMVMSIGRSIEGVRFESCPLPVRYIFCIGVPKVMACDYLRIVGEIARLLKDPRVESALLAAPTSAEFLSHLSLLETRL